MANDVGIARFTTRFCTLTVEVAELGAYRLVKAVYDAVAEPGGFADSTLVPAGRSRVMSWKAPPAFNERTLPSAGVNVRPKPLEVSDREVVSPSRIVLLVPSVI
jgi:hypothetical protein